MPVESGSFCTISRGGVVCKRLIVACGHTASGHEAPIREKSADNWGVGI
jgi:hypothetical protein